MRKSLLIQKLAKYKELQAEKAEIEQQMDSLKAEFIDELKRLGLSKLNVDVYTLTYSEFDASFFNGELFKESHPKLYEKFTSFRPSKRLTVR